MCGRPLGCKRKTIVHDACDDESIATALEEAAAALRDGLI